MPKYTILKKVGFTVPVLLMTACSAGGKISNLSGQTTVIQPADTWAINVVSNDEDFTQEAKLDIGAAIGSKLLATGLARHIALSGQPADQVLDIHVTHYKRVSAGERLMLGVMAGRNHIDADETVKQKDGTIEKQFTVNAESASHPYSGESGMDDATQAFINNSYAALAGTTSQQP